MGFDHRNSSSTVNVNQKQSGGSCDQFYDSTNNKQTITVFGDNAQIGGNRAVSKLSMFVAFN